MRADAGDCAMVAALCAEAFFDSPSLQTLRALETAAEQAGVASAARYPTIATGARNGAVDHPCAVIAVAHGSGTCQLTPVRLASAK